MSARFLYSVSLGRGVIFVNGKAEQVVEIDKDPELQPAKGVHLGMFLQGPNDLQETDIEGRPLDEVLRRFRRACGDALEDALRKAGGAGGGWG